MNEYMLGTLADKNILECKAGPADDRQALLVNVLHMLLDQFAKHLNSLNASDEVPCLRIQRACRKKPQSTPSHDPLSLVILVAHARERQRDVYGVLEQHARSSDS